MTTQRRLALLTAVLLAASLVGGVALAACLHFNGSMTITAYFTRAAGIYPGDDVRISGVKVGRIQSIDPQPERAKLVMSVGVNKKIPAQAKAVIVAQNLVAARYIQLTPALYEQPGPVMRDGAVIPLERTAVPVEWDEVKAQLTRLATELAPTTASSTSSVRRFVTNTADAMADNGVKLRQTLSQLSQIGRLLADGSGDIVETIKNLQTFISTLRGSTDQMAEFEDHLATFSTVINDSRSDLDSALRSLSVAVGEVHRFVADTRDKTAEQVQRLANVTQTLVDRRSDVENILHGAPTAFSNTYNIYNPNVPGALGTFIINNFSNPMQFICGAIGAVENATAAETSKLCGLYLGPALRTVDFNYLPIPLNPVLQRVATPDKIAYADPRLAPGGGGPAPTTPDIPPAVSAYQEPNAALVPQLQLPPGPTLEPHPTLQSLLLPGGQVTESTTTPPVGGP